MSVENDRLRCNTKTLNAIAETLVERLPGSAESASIIREAGAKLEAYKVLLGQIAYPRRGTEEEITTREQFAERIQKIISLREINGDND